MLPPCGRHLSATRVVQAVEQTCFLSTHKTYFGDGAGAAIDRSTSGPEIGRFIVVKIPVLQTISQMGSRRGVFTEHIRGPLEQGNPGMLKTPVVGRLPALPPPPWLIPCASVQCKNLFPLSGWNKDSLFYHVRIQPLGGDTTQHPSQPPPSPEAGLVAPLPQFTMPSGTIINN